MLGMEDGWIALVWWLCLLSTIGGVVYGAVNWNHGDEAKVKKGKGVEHR
jgi:hypothetical protein